MQKVVKRIGISIIIILLFVLSVIVIMSYKVDDRIDKLNNYDKLSKKPVGWLIVQGTNIDFPVLYSDDALEISNPKYELGWTYSTGEELANHIVVMSHNIRNVSNKPIIGDKKHRRFEQLMAYIYYDFVKDNKYIQYTTNNKNYLYKVYGVYLKRTSDVELYDIDKKDIKKYYQGVKKDSYFDFSVDMNENDKLLTLVTCTRFYGEEEYSFVVEARRVRKYELPLNYKVKKNKKYDEIEKTLEGVDNDE